MRLEKAKQTTFSDRKKMEAFKPLSYVLQQCVKEVTKLNILSGADYLILYRIAFSIHSFIFDSLDFRLLFRVKYPRSIA